VTDSQAPKTNQFDKKAPTIADESELEKEKSLIYYAKYAVMCKQFRMHLQKKKFPQRY